ncbi:MAG: 50S ribosomal protein L20 [Myxococcota bacterium]|jgi:large subunit ribosomal protein L20
MPRVKGGTKTKNRHRKVLTKAKGYYAGRRTGYKMAVMTLQRAQAFAFSGRKEKKRDYRALWIERINAAVRPLSITYSSFMNGLKRAGVILDRKVLAKIAVDDPAAMSAIVDVAKAALPAAKA